MRDAGVGVVRVDDNEIPLGDRDDKDESLTRGGKSPNGSSCTEHSGIWIGERVWELLESNVWRFPRLPPMLSDWTRDMTGRLVDDLGFATGVSTEKIIN